MVRKIKNLSLKFKLFKSSHQPENNQNILTTKSNLFKTRTSHFL
jgi:hypothetical protein